MNKNVSKKHMAECIGFEYLGKGFDDSCEDGFIVRECGTANHTNIGKTMEQATEWLEDRYNIYMEELSTKAKLILLIGTEDTMNNISNIFINLGYSDMFDVGNIDECIESSNSVAIGKYNDNTKCYDEICVAFDIVRLYNNEEHENNLDTVVKITEICEV